MEHGTVCNQEEHWNELTCDMLISCSSTQHAVQSPQGRMSTILCFRRDLHCRGEMVRNTKISGQNCSIELCGPVAPAPWRGSAHRSMVPAPVVVLPSPAQPWLLSHVITLCTRWCYPYLYYYIDTYLFINPQSCFMLIVECSHLPVSIWL